MEWWSIGIWNLIVKVTSRPYNNGSSVKFSLSLLEERKAKAKDLVTLTDLQWPTFTNPKLNNKVTWSDYF